MKVTFTMRILIITLFIIISLMNCQLLLKNTFSESISKVIINEKLNQNINEKLFLEEITSKQPLTFKYQEENENLVEATINLPFNIKYTMKNFGTEYKTDFSFDVKIKQVSIGRQNETLNFALEKNNLEFSFRTTPLPVYLSLCKQLGAFGLGYDTLFDAIETSFQEKVFNVIRDQITNNLGIKNVINYVVLF